MHQLFEVQTWENSSWEYSAEPQIPWWCSGSYWATIKVI